MRRLQGEEGGLPLAGGAGEGLRGTMLQGSGVRAPKVRGCYARLVLEWNAGREFGGEPHWNFIQISLQASLIWFIKILRETGEMVLTGEELLDYPSPLKSMPKCLVFAFQSVHAFEKARNIAGI